MFSWNKDNIAAQYYNCFSGESFEYEDNLKDILKSPEGIKTNSIIAALCKGLLMVMDHIEKQERPQEPYKCVSCCAPKHTLSPGMICDNCLREQYKNNPPEDQL